MIEQWKRRWRHVKYQLRRHRWYFKMGRKAMEHEEFRAYVQEHGVSAAADQLVGALREVEQGNLAEKYVTVHHGDGTKSYRRKHGT